MGYDTDRFVSPINDALTCCICRDVLEDPVQAPCEHAYCKSCIDGWLVQETSCPEDRRPLTASSLRPLFRYMKNDLNRLRLDCKNKAYGCETITEVEFIETHERECVHQRLKCPNENCAYFAKREDINEHVKQCGYGRTECPKGCGLLITSTADKMHSCIEELRTAMEVLRSEMSCKFDDQKRELQMRLDMQRSHMINKETTLQSQIDSLKSENSKLAADVESLMGMETTRRQLIDRLELENKELTELLRDSAQCKPSVGATTERPSKTRLRNKGKCTTI